VPRKWVRDDEWQRQPHVKDGPPPSLWWYRRPDRHSVINAYIARYGRGRTVPETFKETLVRVLEDLGRIHNKKEWGQPRTLRFWSVPAYALAHEMKKATLMKWLREMETVAKELFADSIPSARKQRTLNEMDKHAIRQRFLEGQDIKLIAEEFRIPSARVGQICTKEKVIRRAQRERESADQVPSTTYTEPDLFEPPF